MVLFDKIIGNPPYICVQDINDDLRNSLKDFFTCSCGSYDLYYAIIEKVLQLLKVGGELSFLTPNTWLGNKSASKLRVLLSKYNVSVIDFRHEKMFDSADTFVSIISVRKESSDNPIKVESNGKTFNISKSSALNGDVWASTISKKYKNIDLKNGTCSLADTVFIFDKKDENKYFSKAKNDWVELEDGAIRKTIKASKLKDCWSIFPYDNNGKLIEDFLDKYPKTKEYLESMKSILLDRDYSGKWWEYGRLQGLKNMYGEKIVVSRIVGPKGFLFKKVSDPNVIVYSGLFQTDHFDDLLSFLNDTEVISWILENGKKYGSGYSYFTNTLLKPLLE